MPHHSALLNKAITGNPQHISSFSFVFLSFFTQEVTGDGTIQYISSQTKESRFRHGSGILRFSSALTYAVLQQYKTMVDHLQVFVDLP